MVDIKLKEIKNADLEDFLCSKYSAIEDASFSREFDNATILITGAAGSIGSEITRRLNHFKFDKLILVDISESSLYDLQQDLFQLEINNIVAIVADLRDKNRMSQIFESYKPKIVFHSAAYKHVPLMENNPNEAVGVNICGTKNVANLSIQHGVDKFILISTDKAVNPTNVMGATKRIAELYIKCLDGRGKTKFIATRFGNVIGSSGSVIPLFKNQIKKGGPLTVTHKDMERYFMSISMASHLVLQATTMGNGGEIFAFNMTKPIKIYELAIKMISLSGLRFPNDIDIKIIGLRPGEKIVEELYSENETMEPTYHNEIFVVKSIPFKKEIIEAKIDHLCQMNSKSQKLEIVALMKKILPEYVSNNSKYELLDTKKPTN